MNNARARSILSALALTLVSAPGPLLADAGTYDEASFENLDELPVESVLPPRFLHSAHYSIEPRVIAGDNFYRFDVSTDRGNYRITSLAMLRARLHEIVTIEELGAQNLPRTPRFERNPGGRRGVLSEDVVDILTDPMGTASQLMGNLGYNLEQTFTADAQDAPLAVRGKAGVDLAAGPHKRAAAQQLGVDVYSSNPLLQSVLNEAAQARSEGRTARSISPLIRDIYATPGFGSGVFDARLNSELKNLDSAQIHDEVDTEMRQLGVTKRTRVAFLTHPAYTPRTRLYFTGYVSLLAPLDNIEWLFTAATAARTEADAVAYVNYARMLAFFDLRGGDFLAVVTEARFPTLSTRSGNAVLALPLDYLAWTEPVARAADVLGEIRRERALSGFTVLLAGTPTPKVVKILAGRKVEVLEQYSFGAATR